VPDEAPTLEPLADGTGFRVRVRRGKARNRYRIPSTDRDFAERRAAVLVELGTALGNAPPDLANSWIEQAGETDGPGLLRIQAAVAKFAASAVKVKRKEESPAPPRA